MTWVVAVTQPLSHVRLFVTPWSAACQASLSFSVSWNLLKLMSIETVTPSNHLILCRPLLFPPSIFPSISVFSNESALHVRRPKYWIFSISPSSEYSVLISFRIDWFDLLAVQTLKNFESLEVPGSSPAPQFKNINSLVLCLLYGPNGLLIIVSIIMSLPCSDSSNVFPSHSE